MKKYLSAVFLVMVIIISCVNQRPAYIPDADSSYFEYERTIDVEIDNIIQTKDGSPEIFLPEWLQAFFYSGIRAVEIIESYSDKYVFIAMQQGESFAALNIWAERFSVRQDFSMLAGTRIERRMISSASIYPDYEYGLFFERMVKNAYSGEYPGTVKEDTYWIKTKIENADSDGDFTDDDFSEIYMVFILLSMDKFTMQNIIEEMMSQTFDSVSSTRDQAAAINRLRQNFFTGF